MAGVPRAMKFRFIWCWITMYVEPIDALKPLMGLFDDSLDQRYETMNSPLTLMCSAPSTLLAAPKWGKNALRRALTIIEFGRDTEAVDWEPRRSSGSQINCSIRLIASCETRGREGNRNACLWLRIFCRVIWRCRGHRQVSSRANLVHYAFLPSC